MAKQAFDRIPGVASDILRRPGGIERDPPPGRRRGRESGVPAANLAVEGKILRAGTNRLGLAAFARQANRGVKVEVEHHVRFQSPGGEAVRGLERLETEATAVALVGEGTPGEAVADDDGASPERRNDDLTHQLSAGNEEGEGLGPGGEGFMEEAANEFARGRAARFAGEHDLAASGTQALSESSGERALARALATFEHHESSDPFWRSHIPKSHSLDGRAKARWYTGHMASPVTTRRGAGEVGKVVISVTVRNADDVRRSRRGDIAEADVREIVVDDVLCDTGATTLCLTSEMIDFLGLPVGRRATVSTAVGSRTVNIYEDARITIAGRSGIVECLELPGGTQPLLGVIPMEQLGLELDLQNQRLVVLPDTGDDTYLTIL